MSIRILFKIASVRAPSASILLPRHPNNLHRRSGHAFGCSPRPTWLAPRAPVGYLPLSLPETKPIRFIYSPTCQYFYQAPAKWEHFKPSMYLFWNCKLVGHYGLQKKIEMSRCKIFIALYVNPLQVDLIHLEKNYEIKTGRVYFKHPTYKPRQLT